MTTEDILRIRYCNQGLDADRFPSPEEAIAALGAVQAQDYPGAKWALGQRVHSSNDTEIEKAFNAGKILRTHVMRPTWHFVHPEDISWLLTLTAPRVSKLMATYNKKLELTDAVFTKSQATISSLLKKKNIVTREEIKIALEDGGIKTDVQRLAHLVMQAELDQLIISGPKQESQFTYMRFSDRVPKTRTLSLDEAVAELTNRYFTSHGPAQIHDFVWWSGLTIADAKKGLDMNKKLLLSEEIDGKIYYFSSPPPHSSLPTSLNLLPNYDEFTIGYKDRSAFYTPSESIKIYSMGMLAFPHVILYKGKVIGVWRREIKKNTVTIRPKFIQSPDKTISKAFTDAVETYSEFLGKEVQVEEK